MIIMIILLTCLSLLKNDRVQPVSKGPNTLPLASLVLPLVVLVVQFRTVNASSRQYAHQEERSICFLSEERTS